MVYRQVQHGRSKGKNINKKFNISLSIFIHSAISTPSGFIAENHRLSTVPKNDQYNFRFPQFLETTLQASSQAGIGPW